jgi:hypothetical protein
MRTLGARECRHARHPQGHKPVRIGFFGFHLAWNMVWNGLGRGGVLSALRLPALLWPVRLHLCSARSFRLPAVRTAGELLPAACLFHYRLSPRADHGALSAVNGRAPITVGIHPPAVAPGSQGRVTLPPDRLRRSGVLTMGDSNNGFASALDGPRLGGAAERYAYNVRAFGTVVRLAAVRGNRVRPRRLRSKPACVVAPATYLYPTPTPVRVSAFATPLPSRLPPPARFARLLLSSRLRQALPTSSHCRRCRAG